MCVCVCGRGGGRWPLAPFTHTPLPLSPSLLVLTDGHPMLHTFDYETAIHTRQMAEAERTRGVIILAIGVGNGINAEELEAMASEPKANHWTSLGSFESLLKLSEAISGSCVPQIPGGSSRLWGCASLTSQPTRPISTSAMESDPAPMYRKAVHVVECAASVVHSTKSLGGMDHKWCCAPPPPPVRTAFQALIRPSGEDAMGRSCILDSPPGRWMPAAVRMPAVVRTPACHSRRFKGERPIGAATG